MTDSITRREYLDLTIQDKLKFWIEMPRGTVLDRTWDPMPWDHYVREICGLALDEIVGLRKRQDRITQTMNELRQELEATRTFGVKLFNLNDGSKGDIFTFTMEREGCTFEEAVAKLANLAGLLPEKKS